MATKVEACIENLKQAIADAETGTGFPSTRRLMEAMEEIEGRLRALEATTVILASLEEAWAAREKVSRETSDPGTTGGGPPPGQNSPSPGEPSSE